MSHLYWYGVVTELDQALAWCASALHKTATDNKHLSWKQIGLQVLGLPSLPREFDNDGQRHYFGADVSITVKRWCWMETLPYPYRCRGR